MINTYEEYLKNASVLTVEDAMDIYQRMADSIKACSLEDKMDFWNHTLRLAADYSNTRNRWELLSTKERISADKSRTMEHDAFIISVNVLARIAAAEGIDNSWRKELGDNRKRLGDFACWIAYITGISNR